MALDGIQPEIMTRYVTLWKKNVASYSTLIYCRLTAYGPFGSIERNWSLGDASVFSFKFMLVSVLVLLLPYVQAFIDESVCFTSEAYSSGGQAIGAMGTVYLPLQLGFPRRGHRWRANDGSARRLTRLLSTFWAIDSFSSLLHVYCRATVWLPWVSSLSMQWGPLGSPRSVGKLASRVFIIFTRICAIIYGQCVVWWLASGITGRKVLHWLLSQAMAVRMTALYVLVAGAILAWPSKQVMLEVMSKGTMLSPTTRSKNSIGVAASAPKVIGPAFCLAVALRVVLCIMTHVEA